MSGTNSFFLLSAAVFLGAFVSGFAGFACSAVAGGILLHTLAPTEAVPLMMACSVSVQATNLWAFRGEIQWKQSLVLVLGGMLGVPIAVWLLQRRPGGAAWAPILLAFDVLMALSIAGMMVVSRWRGFAVDVRT